MSIKLTEHIFCAAFIIVRLTFHSCAGGVFALVPVVEGMVSWLFVLFLIFCAIKLYYDVSQLRLGVLRFGMLGFFLFLFYK